MSVETFRREGLVFGGPLGPVECRFPEFQVSGFRGLGLAGFVAQIFDFRDVPEDSGLQTLRCGRVWPVGGAPRRDRSVRVELNRDVFKVFSIFEIFKVFARQRTPGKNVELLGRGVNFRKCGKKTPRKVLSLVAPLAVCGGALRPGVCCSPSGMPAGGRRASGRPQPYPCVLVRVRGRL